MAYIGQHVFVDEYEPDRDRYTLTHYRVSEVFAGGDVMARQLPDVGLERLLGPDEFVSSDFNEVESMAVTGCTLDAVADWCDGMVTGESVVLWLGTTVANDRLVGAPTGTTLIRLHNQVEDEHGWRVRTATGAVIQEGWV